MGIHRLTGAAQSAHVGEFYVPKININQTQSFYSWLAIPAKELQLSATYTGEQSCLKVEIKVSRI